MNKAELVDRVAATVQLPQYRPTRRSRYLLQGIMDALQAGDKVGIARLWELPAAPSPSARGTQIRKTGDPVQIPARKVPWFKAGKISARG